MLVLTRKVGEGLRVGQAQVHVLAVERDRVKIGIEAPKEVLILRLELVEKKCR